MKRFLILLSLLFCNMVYADTINLHWLNEDGTTYQNSTCVIDSDLILPATPPTKYGYTFTGWKLANYIPLEYIESTGTQYIDTGIRPIDVTEIIADFAFTNTNLRNNPIVAAHKHSADLYNYIGEHSAFNGFGENWGSGTSGYKGFGVLHNTNRHTWKVDTTTFKFYLDNTLKTTQTNGRNIDTTFTIASTGFANLVGTTGRFYSVKFSLNDTIVRDFIPVLDMNGVPCMYDKVTKQFFYNQGTGQFIAGPVINE